MRSILDICGQADEYFMKRSPVHDAARRIARALKEAGVPFAIAGALAVNAHGHVRTTDDVDLLLTRDGLAAFKMRWLGRGWVEVFEGSKAIRDTEARVKIDVLLAGDYPGDGRPKPVRFPEPQAASEPDEDGLPVLTLPMLLELKIASGMTAPHRLQDLADAIALIRVNRLAPEYADELDAYVRDKYAELWRAAQVEEDF